MATCTCPEIMQDLGEEVRRSTSMAEKDMKRTKYQFALDYMTSSCPNRNDISHWPQAPPVPTRLNSAKCTECQQCAHRKYPKMLSGQQITQYQECLRRCQECQQEEIQHMRSGTEATLTAIRTLEKTLDNLRKKSPHVRCRDIQLSLKDIRSVIKKATKLQEIKHWLKKLSEWKDMCQMVSHSKIIIDQLNDLEVTLLKKRRHQLN